MIKRQVFISFHHKNEQSVVDDFVNAFSTYYDVFTDRSLDRAADSDDTEYLNQVCRDAIEGTSITIVIIGTETGKRKFVDWEIKHTLLKKHGLLAIFRPNLEDHLTNLPNRLIDNINSGYSNWYKYPSSPEDLRLMLEKAYNINKALIDNSREKMKRNL